MCSSQTHWIQKYHCVFCLAVGQYFTWDIHKQSGSKVRYPTSDPRKHPKWSWKPHRFSQHTTSLSGQPWSSDKANDKGPKCQQTLTMSACQAQWSAFSFAPLVLLLSTSFLRDGRYLVPSFTDKKLRLRTVKVYPYQMDIRVIITVSSAWHQALLSVPYQSLPVLSSWPTPGLSVVSLCPLHLSTFLQCLHRACMPGDFSSQTSVVTVLPGMTLFYSSVF